MPLGQGAGHFALEHLVAVLNFLFIEFTGANAPFLRRELTQANSSDLGSNHCSHLGFYMRFALVTSCSTELPRGNSPDRWSNIAPNV
jgi:hypothetical protein